MKKLVCPVCQNAWAEHYWKWIFKSPFHWFCFDVTQRRFRDFRKTTCPYCKTKSWIAPEV